MKFLCSRWKSGFKIDGWNGNVVKRPNKKPKVERRAATAPIRRSHPPTRPQSLTMPARRIRWRRKIKAARGKFKRANLSIDLMWCNAIIVLKRVKKTLFEVEVRLMETDLRRFENSQCFCTKCVLRTMMMCSYNHCKIVVDVLFRLIYFLFATSYMGSVVRKDAVNNLKFLHMKNRILLVNKLCEQTKIVFFVFLRSHPF